MFDLEFEIRDNDCTPGAPPKILAGVRVVLMAPGAPLAEGPAAEATTNDQGLVHFTLPLRDYSVSLSAGRVFRQSQSELPSEAPVEPPPESEVVPEEE